MTNTP